MSKDKNSWINSIICGMEFNKMELKGLYEPYTIIRIIWNFCYLNWESFHLWIFLYIFFTI